MSTETIELITKAADRIGAVEQSVSTLDTRMRDIEQKSVGSSATRGALPSRNPLTAIVNSPEVKAFSERRTKSATIPVEGLTIKNILVNGNSGSSDADGYDTQAQRAQILANDPRRQLRLLNVLPRLPVTTNKFEYVRLDGYSNAAAEQGQEGAAKATASVPTTVETANIVTVAHVLRVSEQVLADNAALQMQLNNLLSFGVADKAEQLIVAGNGDVQGIETSATVFTPTALSAADRIGEAAAELEVDGWIATHVLLHPRDWQRIRSERATGDDHYTATGWNMPAAPNLWGLPVITTSSLTEGTALVIDANQLAILDRMQTVVDLGRINDDFARNVVAIRAEARIGLAIFSAGAVLSVDIGGSSGP